MSPTSSSRILTPIPFVIAIACGEAGLRRSLDVASSTRDSAGVEIVESIRPAWRDSERWTLSEDPVLRLRGGGEEGGLLDPASIDVDSRGRIIIADGDQFGRHAIMVYDSLGTFLFQAGRPGEGPGEFGQLWWASTYRGDSIVGFDMADDQVAVFDPEGRFVRQVSVPLLQNPRPPRGTYSFTNGIDAAFGDGSFLAYPRGVLNMKEGPGPAWYQHTLIRLHPAGESWDTLGVFEIGLEYWDGTSQQPLRFGPFASTATGRHALYHGRGDAFQVARYDSAGRLNRLIRRAHEPRPVTEEMKQRLKQWMIDWMSTSSPGHEQAVARILKEFSSGHFAETLPAYSALILDDLGYLWVEEYRWIGDERSPLSAPVQWSVFDPSGAWLGNIATPAGFIMREVTRNRVFGFVIDKMGVSEVHAYALYR